MIVADEPFSADAPAVAAIREAEGRNGARAETPDRGPGRPAVRRPQRRLRGAHEHLALVDDRDVNRGPVIGKAGRLLLPAPPAVGRSEHEGPVLPESPAGRRGRKANLVFDRAHLLSHGGPGRAAVVRVRDGPLQVPPDRPAVLRVHEEEVLIRVVRDGPHTQPGLAAVVGAEESDAGVLDFELKPGRADRPARAVTVIGLKWESAGRLPRVAPVGCVKQGLPLADPAFFVGGENDLSVLGAVLAPLDHALPG